MDNEMMTQFTRQLDELRTQVNALQDAFSKIPSVVMQPDPSRPVGVIVTGPIGVAPVPPVVVSK